jgi:hypothetical protein
VAAAGHPGDGDPGMSRLIADEASASSSAVVASASNVSQTAESLSPSVVTARCALTTAILKYLTGVRPVPLTPARMSGGTSTSSAASGSMGNASRGGPRRGRRGSLDEIRAVVLRALL